MNGYLRTSRQLAFAAAILITTTGVVAVGAARAGSIDVDDARAEMMEGQTARGDIFMKITNTGDAADRLYAVRTRVAERAALETESEDEVVAGRTAETASLLIKPGETVSLSEDGPHIELFGLSKEFETGESFVATLFFEQAGRIKVTVTVEEED